MNRAEHTHPEKHTGAIGSKLNWLRAAVLGVNDGIISIAALVVGVAGATTSSATLLLTGVSGLLAGAFSMAVGEYVSVSSQRDTEKALLDKERYELEHFHEDELDELTGLYEQKGLSRETARKAAEELTAHNALAAHAETELKLDPDALTNPAEAAIASAISYSVGGILPILAIVLPPEPMRILATFAAVIVALIITGIGSAMVSGAKAVPVTLRVLIGGILAMAVTYGIGILFHGII